MNTPASTIHAHLTRHARRVAVVPHKNPDGDTLGAAVAFYIYLKRRGVDAKLWCKTPVSVALAFLPHVSEMHFSAETWEHEQFDTVCVFDAGDPVFAGVQERIDALHTKPTIINFDHHHTNTRFGDFNFVNTHAASTTEVVYDYLTALGELVDRDTATALMTGLMTDTGNFSNPATSERALEIGADLTRRGANYKAILNYTYLNKSADALKLWGIALTRLKINLELSLAYTALTRADMEGLAVTENDLEGIANLLNSVGTAKVALVLKETRDGFVKGSLRTTHDDADVAAIAAAFGGGGHQKAAGFAVRGTLAEKNGEWIIVTE